LVTRLSILTFITFPDTGAARQPFEIPESLSSRLFSISQALKRDPVLNYASLVLDNCVQTTVKNADGFASSAVSSHP
jgi:hypothetical protein